MSILLRPFPVAPPPPRRDKNFQDKGVQCALSLERAHAFLTPFSGVNFLLNSKGPQGFTTREAVGSGCLSWANPLNPSPRTLFL